MAATECGWIALGASKGHAGERALTNEHVGVVRSLSAMLVQGRRGALAERARSPRSLVAVARPDTVTLDEMPARVIGIGGSRAARTERSVAVAANTGTGGSRAE